MYRDPVSLYETTLRRNPDCWMAHNNLGIIFSEANRIDEAVQHQATALRLKPDFVLAANNLGYNLLRQGRAAEAEPVLQRAVTLRPDYAVAHRNLGLVLATLDRTHEPIRTLSRHRKWDGATWVCVKVVPETNGMVRPGDDVEVLE